MQPMFSWLNLSFFLSSSFLPETPDPLSERQQQMDPSSPAGVVIDGAKNSGGWLSYCLAFCLHCAHAPEIQQMIMYNCATSPFSFSKISLLISFCSAPAVMKVFSQLGGREQIFTGLCTVFYLNNLL